MRKKENNKNEKGSRRRDFLLESAAGLCRGLIEGAQPFVDVTKI
jgi:hypothetical protein